MMNENLVKQAILFLESKNFKVISERWVAGSALSYDDYNGLVRHFCGFLQKNGLEATLEGGMKKHIVVSQLSVNGETVHNAKFILSIRNHGNSVGFMLVADGMVYDFSEVMTFDKMNPSNCRISQYVLDAYLSGDMPLECLGTEDSFKF